MGKYNTILVKKNVQDTKEQLQQDSLKKKHNITKDVIVVEKSNWLKFIFKGFSSIIHYAATFILVLLAIIGLASLIYPGPRGELIVIGMDAYHELVNLLS